MAKNDKNEELKPQPAPVEAPKVKETPKPHGHFPPPPPPKKPFRRKFFDLLTLVLVGTTAFLAYDSFETKKINADLLNKLQADCNRKNEALADKVNRLAVEIKQVENRPVVAENALSEAEYMSLLADLKKQLPEVNKSENTEEKTIAEKSEPAVQKIADEVLLASGAMIVRGLAESGQSFVYEAEVLQILAQGNDIATAYVDTVKKYAVSGISGRKMLIDEFNSIHKADMQKQEQKDQSAAEKEQSGLKDSFMRRLKNLVVLQKREEPKPVFAKASDEVYELVNNGQFAEALNKLKTDNKYTAMPNPALQEWVVQVQSHLDFDRAVNGLIMNALANLRLKEFTRD